MASCQPSTEKTELYTCSTRTVAGVLGASVLDVSYMARVREMASLTTSLRRTAVEVK
jgi:hypothetical protein